MMTVQQYTIDLLDKSMDQHNSVPVSAGSDGMIARPPQKPGLDS